MRSATEVIPGACGLAGFAVALLSGLAAERQAISVLIGAIVALLICRLVGTGVASVCSRLAEDAVRRHKDLNPVPDVRAALRDAAGPSEPAGA